MTCADFQRYTLSFSNSLFSSKSSTFPLVVENTKITSFEEGLILERFIASEQESMESFSNLVYFSFVVLGSEENLSFISSSSISDAKKGSGRLNLFSYSFNPELPFFI